MNYQRLKNNSFVDLVDESLRGLECLWCFPSSVISITDSEIHVWRIQLNMPSNINRSFDQIFSLNEQLKAGRFRSKTDTLQYKVSHWALRQILSKYLCIDPKIIQYSYNPLGKPSLAFDVNTKQICFSFSHSNRYALCAVTLKEAYLKATGKGVASLKDVEIAFTWNGSISAIIEKGHEPEEENWTILQFLPVNGYTVVIAVEGRGEFIYRFYNFLMNDND